jgi:adenosine deaminase
MRRIARDGTVIECCLSSNLQTGAVPSLAVHPLGRFLDAGILCALSTDNTTVSGTTLVDEYLKEIDLLDLSENDVRRLAAVAWDSTFIGWRPWEAERRPQLSAAQGARTPERA